MATVSDSIQVEDLGSSSGGDMSTNSSNAQIHTPCPNTTYSIDENEGKSDGEVVVETVTSTETCEFDELWSMDPTSVKLKGIALIQDEKFDFNISEELDISLESVESSALITSTTDSPDDWVFPKLNTTTTIGERGLGSRELPDAPDKEWVFPIGTTPTKASALSGKEPTSGAVIPDRRQAEDWVLSKMFQLDTGGSESCSDAEKPPDVKGTDPFSGLNEEVLARLRDTAPSPPPCSGDETGGVSLANVGASDDCSGGNGGRGVVTRVPNKARVKVGTNRENRNSATSQSSGGDGVKLSRISKIAQPVATTDITKVNSKSKLSKIAPKQLPGPSIKPTLLPRAVSSKGRVPADVGNKLGAKPAPKSRLAKPAHPGSRLNGKVGGSRKTKALVKRDTTFLKSERTYVKSDHQTVTGTGECDTTRVLQNAECCALDVDVPISAPSALGARVVQSTPKERRTAEQVVKGETITKEVHCLRQVNITPIAKVTAATTSPPKTAKCEDENNVQLNETHSVYVSQANAPSGPNLVTPKSRVGRRSLIPTPHGQKDGGEKLELTSPIKYDATTRAKRKSLFGKAVADEKTLGNMGMSPQLDGDKENASLPVVKKSGLQRPSKIRGGRRGEENVNKVGVAAVRGRRGPFRPLNGLASRQVEAPSPVYSNYTMEGENMLVSRPKVVHSPVDKENVATKPLSKWSPIKKKHNLDESCFRCTKRLK